MYFSKKEIKHLALNNLSDEQLQDGLEALNKLADIFGKAWILDYFQNSQAPIFVTSLIDFWKELRLVIGLSNSNKLIKKLKNGLRKEIDTETEVFVYSRLIQRKLKLELFPLIQEKIPDCRFRLSDHDRWIYAEVSKKDWYRSWYFKHYENIWPELLKKASEVNPEFEAKITLLKFPTLDEKNSIIDWLESLKNEEKSELEQLAIFQIGLKLKPNQSKVAHGNSEDVINYEIQGKLEDESEQLPINHPSILFIDLSSAGGKYNIWIKKIDKVFKTVDISKVSAVIAIERSHYSVSKLKPVWKSEMIVNPKAKNKLTKKEIEILKGFSKLTPSIFNLLQVC